MFARIRGLMSITWETIRKKGWETREFCVCCIPCYFYPLASAHPAATIFVAPKPAPPLPASVQYHHGVCTPPRPPPCRLGHEMPRSRHKDITTL